MSLTIRSRRRAWYIQGRQQLGFVGTMLLHCSAVLAAYGALSLYVGLRLRSLTSGLVKPDDYPQIAADLASSTRWLVIGLALAAGITAALLSLVGLYGSHKLAGPTLRIRRMLAEILRGDASQRAAFRHRDRLSGLALELNQVAARIDSYNGRIKAELPFLAGHLQDLRVSLEDGAPALRPKEIESLEASLGRLLAACREPGVSSGGSR